MYQNLHAKRVVHWFYLVIIGIATRKHNLRARMCKDARALKELGGYRVVAPCLLNKLSNHPGSTHSVAYAWERAARWSTQVCRDCWVAASLSCWVRCSDHQGSAYGTENINPAKMKLCPGIIHSYLVWRLQKPERHMRKASHCGSKQQ